MSWVLMMINLPDDYPLTNWMYWQELGSFQKIEYLLFKKSFFRQNFYMYLCDLINACGSIILV